MTHSSLFKRLLVLGGFALLSAGCAVSHHQAMAEDRMDVYLDASKEYHALERKYLELLANLERMPKEPWLLEQKKIQMKELEHLRELLLQSRSELDEAVQQWELHLQDLRSVQAETGPFPGNAPSTQKLPWEARQ